MVESEIESDSTRKNDYYQQKIERMTEDYENQNKQKNQEFEELYEEINSENNNLKKDLMIAREELEKEMEKNIDIKSTLYNFNYISKINFINELDEKIHKNRNIKNKKRDYTNSQYSENNIKIIQEETKEKILALNKEQENSIKNFEIMKTSLENSIKNIPNIINDQENLNISINSILNELNIFSNKYNSLLTENYSDKKYIIILLEKLGLQKEENSFLKERIIKEKKIILEKINSLSHNNELTHINLIQELLNEIKDKRRNYFNEQFFIPIQNLHQGVLDFKEKEKELINNNEQLKKELDELQYKYDKLNEEKEEFVKNEVSHRTNKDNSKNNETYLQSVINKLRKEKDLLENENNSLLKNNTQLNEQIISINNKIKFEILQNKKRSDILLNQKENFIKELNNKLNYITEMHSRDKLALKNLKEEIDSLNNKIQDYKINENNLKTEILTLKKKFHETCYKSTNNQTNTLENIITNPQKMHNIQTTEKKAFKDKIKYNYRNKNTELDSSNKESLKLTSTEKIRDEGDNIALIIKKIYLEHISNDIDNNNEINMLKEINMKLNMLENNSNYNNNNQYNRFIKLKIVYNEDFDNLDQNKNSQLYENILIYLFHLKSQQKIELNKIINSYLPLSDTKNKKIAQNFDNLKTEFEEKYTKLSERIKNSINLDELEQIISELKNFYEIIIDYIIQNFYKNKRDLTENILTIQLPLEEYHKIINNTMANLTNIETNIVNKINEYRIQGNKIESALNILLDNVDNYLNM